MNHIPSLSLAQGLLSNPLPLQLNEFFKPSVPLFYNYIHIYKKCQKTPCLLRLGMNGTRSEARIAGGAEVIVA